jgi:hypothetical protein
MLRNWIALFVWDLELGAKVESSAPRLSHLESNPMMRCASVLEDRRPCFAGQLPAGSPGAIRADATEV